MVAHGWTSPAIAVERGAFERLALVVEIEDRAFERLALVVATVHSPSIMRATRAGQSH